MTNKDSHPKTGLKVECDLMVDTLRDVVGQAEANIAIHRAVGGPTPAAAEAVRDARRVVEGAKYKARGDYPTMLRSLVRVVSRWATQPPAVPAGSAAQAITLLGEAS